MELQISLKFNIIQTKYAEKFYFFIQKNIKVLHGSGIFCLFTVNSNRINSVSLRIDSNNLLGICSLIWNITPSLNLSLFLRNFLYHFFFFNFIWKWFVKFTVWYQAHVYFVFLKFCSSCKVERPTIMFFMILTYALIPMFERLDWIKISCRAF